MRWTRETRELAVSEPIKPRDILGNAETRKLCGNITRSTLIRWREEFGFPAPIRELEQGDLWRRQDVKAWLATSRPKRGPKPGN